MISDKDNPGTTQRSYRPGEGSSAPGGKDRPSYERYGNYGLVEPAPSADPATDVSRNTDDSVNLKT